MRFDDATAHLAMPGPVSKSAIGAQKPPSDEQGVRRCRLNSSSATAQPRGGPQRAHSGVNPGRHNRGPSIRGNRRVASHQDLA
jgi:hypothetical protein